MIGTKPLTVPCAVCCAPLAHVDDHKDFHGLAGALAAFALSERAK